ncbi:MAG: PQQ-binding-like beta-propeller repeat protein [Sedimentisphaerales bacterium]|nr:PQQ-binding-like beta-propeller repeat protein [Sedimentisphaerales bacterium]
MKIKNKKSTCVFVLLFLVCLQASLCRAVTSRVTRHSSSQEFLKGETNDVVIGSRGTIQLGRRAEVLVKQFEDVWSINSIIVSGDVVYVGTSPNGGVYAFSAAGLKKVYSAKLTSKPQHRDTKDANEPNDANAVQPEKHLANEHIFAMATDVAGRLLVGISGQRCALSRLEAGEIKVLFEPNDANYIFAIAVDKGGDIYLGTGPQGKVYRLDSLGKNAELVYDSSDKNILSLAQGPDGFIYAGSDSRGLIYRINPRTKEVKVLYDSEQQEITALLFCGEDLYAAATSANVVQAEARFAAQAPQAGRPEQVQEEEPPEGDSSGGMKLQIANTKKPPAEQPPEHKGPPPRPPRPVQASFLYKITKDGFVTDIFNEMAVFFCLAAQDKELLVGTGNSAQLFCVEPASEERAIVYEDRQASQLTAVAVSGDDVYVGMANPARLVKLAKVFAGEGTYTSALVDAGQPAKWGKLQIEADVPADCNVLVACRSGNVKDVNDPSFSKWTELQEVTGPVQLDCPAGRFCQYKLVLRGNDGRASPIVREVAVAQTVPNLAPRVESVSVSRMDAPGKAGVFKIGYDVKDDNGDKLIYKIDFRKVGRTGWIEIKDALESNSFEWDAKTVEDGRYEIRVTASDERSNTPDTKLTGSRVSDAVVVDNTGPVVKSHTIRKSGKSVTLKMTVSDELSAIGKVEYTIDSDANWIGVVPDDLVYDTTSEDFAIVADKLAAGQHVIALKLADDVDNTTYKTFEVTIEEK